MDSLAVIFYSAIVGGFGYVLVSVLGKVSFNEGEKISIGYGLGIGFAGYLLFYLSRFGIGWGNYVPFLLICALLFVVYLIWNKEIPRSVRFAKFKMFEKVFVVLIILAAVYTFIQNQLRPVVGWDAWAIWLLKSKIFYFDGAVRVGSFFYSDSAYPYVLSLYSTSVYLFLGGINDTAVLITYFLIYIAIAGLLFSILKNRIGRPHSLLVVFLYLSTQNVIRHGGRFEAGYSDLALGFYILCSVAVYSRLSKMMNWSGVLLISLFIGLCGMIKNDGLPFSILLFICTGYTVIRSRQYGLLLPLSVGLIPLLDWHLYKIILSLPVEPFPFHPKNNVSYFFSILFHMFQELLNFRNWNLLWVVFVTAVMIQIARQKTVSFLLIAISYQLFVYFLIFLTTLVQPPTAHVDNTINRLLLHITPLAFYYLALTIFEEKQGLGMNVPRLTKMQIKTK